MSKRRKPEYSAIDNADGWVIAQVRGNSDVSDDKCVHRALDALELYYGFNDTGDSGVTHRLMVNLRRADDMTPRGRAVLAACYILRMTGKHYDAAKGVPENLEDQLWPLINEAKAIEGAVESLSAVDHILSAMLDRPRDG